MNKQETLEEFAERLARAFDNDNYKALMQLVEDGAKWQQEKMYSEEEVEQIFNIEQMIKNYGDYKPYTFKEALEQFKKK
jgi:predicted component of type VI protein secretion system